jgi:hypothetical protein
MDSNVGCGNVGTEQKWRASFPSAIASCYAWLKCLPWRRFAQRSLFMEVEEKIEEKVDV